MSIGLTSKTGTVTSFLVLSLNVNPTVTTFLPSTSLIRPLFFTSLAIGCGCACGTVTLFNTRLYSVAGTLPCSFLALAALTDTSGIVKVGFALFASVVSNGTSISSLEPSGYVTVAVIYNVPSCFVWTVLLFIARVKPDVFLLTFTSPRVDENVNVSLILLNSVAVIVVFACVISRSILVLLTVGVYFVACVNALKTTRYGFEATLSLLPDLSLILFSAASIAEA